MGARAQEWRRGACTGASHSSTVSYEIHSARAHTRLKNELSYQMKSLPPHGAGRGAASTRSSKEFGEAGQEMAARCCARAGARRGAGGHRAMWAAASAAPACALQKAGENQ